MNFFWSNIFVEKKGWQKQAIRDHLELLQSPLLTSKGILLLLDDDSGRSD
jgi:hypothetical protein